MLPLIEERSAALHVIACTSGAHELQGSDGCHPAAATVLGAVIDAPQECTRLSARCIDIDPQWSASDHGVLDRLIIELWQVAAPDLLALRQHRRFVRRFQPQRLADATLQLKPERAYLITGGFGGIGLSLAQELVANGARQLILSSRSPLPPREQWSQVADERVQLRIAAVRNLEAAGASVQVLSADIADREAMAAALQQCDPAFPISGIIHAAGAPSDGQLLRDKDPAALTAVFGPKFFGTEVLADLIDWQQLDFVVMMSSLASFLPILGQSDYAAANAYQDAMAHAAAARGVRCLSINWYAWRDVGMAMNHEMIQQRDDDSQLADWILPAEGRAAFRRALAANTPQLAICTRPLAAVERQFAQVVADLHRSAVVSDANDKIAPQGDIELAIAAVWRELFDCDAIGRDDDFYALGGHSLMATQVAARLMARSQLEVPVRDILAHPRLRDLAMRIETVQADVCERDEVEL